jgi:hypothetical protein
MQDGSPEKAFNQAKEILQQAILHDYPNPERKGCPGADVLKRLASSDLPQTSDPAWEHVTHCSPCYAEFLEFREAAKALRQRSRQRNRLLLAAAAALIVICGISLFWWRSRTGAGAHGGATSPVLTANSTPTPGYLDFESVRISRGDEELNGEKHVFKLPIGNIDLKVRLPLGSQDGKYELQILREPGQPPVASASSTSVLEDHSVFLKTRLNLQGLNPGQYYIAIRRAGADWTVSPITLSP